MNKTCRVCKQEKDIELFNKKKSSKDGHDSMCKECQRQYDISRRNNPKRKEYCKDYNKKYYQNNKEYFYEYEKERSKRPERIEYTNKRRKNIAYRLQSNMSSSMYYSLRNNKNNIHWEDLVPYNLEQLKEHLESQFDENMNWNNMGSYREIDHVIPRNTFKNLTTAESRDFQICWSLMNLRPLERSLNRSRPKDGSDISEELKKNKILGQNIQGVIMDAENKRENHING